ncbi:MAG: phosphoribosylamine--glycine ligase [Bacillota bacterium]|nr:phosphoribosylamine--glycine ligase [Bacillota bacterium]MDW7682821.1 phosphoribosylamine--glycine ligase [Bacillota bacterium]
MRILVVGSGGREHTLTWKLMQSPRVQKVYCAPGNAGIATIAECVDLAVDNIQGLVSFALEHEIELTVVGPEAPLTAGIVDAFTAAGLQAFGPDKAAAQLEGSKVFAKSIMEKYQIPTAESRTFTSAEKALAYLREKGAPIVVKADGLAAGKGVVVAQTTAEAEEAVQRIMIKKEFGEAGSRLIVEEFLSGEEVSVLAFTDGNTVIPMVSSQDHKAAYDGDAGPNTGGMGAYSPAPVLTPALLAQVEEQILRPTIAGLRSEGIVYKGVLYAGLMITADGPKVLEYNVRFGDPECQAVLPRLKTDLLPIMLDVTSRCLHDTEIEWHDNHTACVVMASGGYPGSYDKGKPISGLKDAADMEDVYVFHAGTVEKGGKTVTAGGRVLGVTAWGNTLSSALDKAYAAVEKISFAGAQYRTDIGQKALQRKE